MNDRQMNVSLGCVIAYTMWACVVALLFLGTVMESLYWQNWGLAMSAGAATASIRQYFVRTNRLVRTLALARGRPTEDASDGVVRLH